MSKTKKRHYPLAGISLSDRTRRRTRRLARKMRGRPTLAEECLWEALKDSQLGSEFEPQVVIRGWIADFWCPEKGVVIEVDGSSHKGREEADAFRDFIMSMMGIVVLRFTNSEVFGSLPSVLKKIKQVLSSL